MTSATSCATSCALSTCLTSADISGPSIYQSLPHGLIVKLGPRNHLGDEGQQLESQHANPLPESLHVWHQRVFAPRECALLCPGLLRKAVWAGRLGAINRPVLNLQPTSQYGIATLKSHGHWLGTCARGVIVLLTFHLCCCI